MNTNIANISTQAEIDNIEGSFILIFYKNGCPHCKKLSEYCKANESELNDIDLRFFCVEVYSIEREILEKYNITAVPTFVGIVDSQIKFNQVGLNLNANFMGEIEALKNQLKTA